MEVRTDRPFIEVTGSEAAVSEFEVILFMDCTDLAVDLAGRTLVAEITRRVTARMMLARSALESTALIRAASGAPKVSLGFLIVDTFPAPQVRRALMERARTRDVRLRFVTRAWVEAALTNHDEQNQFFAELQRARSMDPFESTAPATTGEDFFGLASDAMRLLADASEREPAVLHGMRSAGKTSLALQAIVRLRARGWPVPHPLVPSDQGRPEDIARSVARSGLELAGLTVPAWCASSSREAVDWTAWKDTIGEARRMWSRRNPDAPFYFVIDEYDGLLEGARRVGASQSLLDLFAAVRELSLHGIARFLFVGLTADIAQLDRFDASVGGTGNPLFMKCRVRPMPLLSSSDATTLLAELGMRVGVEWEGQAVEQCVSLCGGHPLLLRRMGSASLHQLRESSPETWTIHREHVEAAVQGELSVGWCPGYFAELRERLGPGGRRMLGELIAGPVSFQDLRNRFVHLPDAGGLRDALRVGDILRIFVRLPNNHVTLFAELFRRWLVEYDYG